MFCSPMVKLCCFRPISQIILKCFGVSDVIRHQLSLINRSTVCTSFNIYVLKHATFCLFHHMIACRIVESGEKHHCIKFTCPWEDVLFAPQSTYRYFSWDTCSAWPKYTAVTVILEGHILDKWSKWMKWKLCFYPPWVNQPNMPSNVQ